MILTASYPGPAGHRVQFSERVDSIDQACSLLARYANRYGWILSDIDASIDGCIIVHSVDYSDREGYAASDL